MDNSLNIAVLAGLGGMLGWGFADFFAKKTIDKIGDIQSLVIGHCVGSGLILALILSNSFSTFDLPTGSGELVGIFVFGFLQALVYLLIYIGFGKGKLSVLNPLFSSYSAMAALISIVILGEVVGISTILGLGIVIAGILMISLESDNSRKKLRISTMPGLREIGIATILAGIWTVAWADFVEGKPAEAYAGLMYVAMTVAILIYALFKSATITIPRPSIWLYLIGIGVTEVLAYTSISFGFSKTDHTSIIAVLSGAFALPVILLSYLFLKEKVDLIHRIGSLVIVLGIVIIFLVK